MMAENDSASNAMRRDALMDGRGQECIFPDGQTYIAYYHDDEQPEYTVWKQGDDGLFWYLCKVSTIGEATYAMAQDVRGEGERG